MLCLYVYLYSGSTEATEVLVDARTDVNAKGYNGNTPLILAANGGHTSIIRLLLRHPNIKINEVVYIVHACLPCMIYTAHLEYKISLIPM